MSESLIDYLTNPVVVKAVENNLGSEFDSNEQFSDKENEVTQPVEAMVIIDEDGIQQPLKPISEMLGELDVGQCKGRKRNDHIKESNIIVSTPVFDQFSMKTKQTPKFKQKGVENDIRGRKSCQREAEGCGAR